MEKKQVLITLVVALVLGGAGFYGGTKYQSRKDTSARSQQAAQFRQGAAGAQAGAGRRFTGAGQNGGGFLSGEIISKDEKSITVKMRDNGSKIVFLAASTQINKSTAGQTADLTNGEQVTIIGTSNSDGSLTAQNIQIRPVMPSPTNSNN